LHVSFSLFECPFEDRLFPRTLDVIKLLTTWGPTVILSDGDVVFQPHNVKRSGLFDAVEGRVLIYIYKEQELADVGKRFPASHYVMVDDKLRLLYAMKKGWGPKLTTVFVRQGHYANDTAETATYPPADMSIERIGELLHFDLPALLSAVTVGKSPASRAT
jgi:hypothetical protein